MTIVAKSRSPDASESLSDAQHTADLVAQLGTLVNRHSEAGLTAAQWAALRFFARANRFSRTVSAFADYHATTRGTASQTIKMLVERGYLHRVPSPFDGRSQCLGLTASGSAMLAEDPLHQLSVAVERLPSASHAALDTVLQHLLDTVSQAVGKPSFGRCEDCFFCAGRCCRLYRETLDDSDLEQYCINHQTADTRSE